MLVYPKIVMISMISCIGHTVILLVSYLLLAVLVCYSVFVAIYTTSFAGRYLSFSFNPLSVWQLSCFFAVFTSFPISRLGWVNLLAACGLLFILVLLWVTLHCSGFVWSLLSCFVLYVLSTMDLRLLLLFACFHDWSYWF